MIDKLLNFLKNRLVLTFVFFVAFVLLSLVILYSLYPDKLWFSKNYFYLLHFLVIYLDIYLVLYIWKTKDFIIDSRFLFLIALNLLIYTPFYIILKQQKIAEQLSIYAYYVLVLWVIFEIALNTLLSKFKKWQKI